MFLDVLSNVKLSFSFIMAEDEDGATDKNSPQNSNNAESFQENPQNPPKPDLGIEEAKYDVKENGDAGAPEPISSTSSMCFAELFFVA